MTEVVLHRELLREIDAEVAACRERAREQGEALLAATRKECAQREREQLQRLEEEAELRLRRALARLELEERNQLLHERELVIDKIMAEAAQALAAMERRQSDEYLELMRNVLGNCLRLLPEPPLRVRLGSGLAGLAEDLAKRPGIVWEKAPELHGLVAESGDDHLHCDGTVSHLLATLRREREGELVRLLLGETP